MNIIIIFQNGGGVNDGVLNSYCWMYSSFMIPPDFEGPCAKQEHDGSVLYNSYYQASVLKCSQYRILRQKCGLAKVSL